jgi:ABC-type glycerol-3-phosphate transport system permease component
MSAVARIARAVATAALVAAFVFPLYWAVAASLRPEAALFESPSLWPREAVLDHYRALFRERDFLTPIRNSLVVAAATTMLCLVLGGFCAYALARMRFRFKAPILGFILAVTMFPQITIVSPLFLVLRKLHLLNTYPGLIFPYLTFAMPLAVWLLVAFFRQLPADLEQAAMIDGAGRMRVLFSIAVPLALPGLAVCAILTFIYCWNEFLFALSFTVGPERRTVPVAVALFRGQYRVPWGEVIAATVVATAPVALLVLAFQRWIVSGLTAGAVKG